MIIKLLRLGIDVELSKSSICTLEVENCFLFTRIVSALLSEEGEYAEEPYMVLDENGKKTTPKKALHVLNALPDVPLNDRSMLAKLFRFASRQSELNPELYEQIRFLSTALEAVTEEIIGGLRGDYALAVEWNYETYLKSFGLSPISGKGYSLLDNCIRFFGFCADIGDSTPIVLVNAKSFFSENELDELFSQAVFSGIELLLLESWRDTCALDLERKPLLTSIFALSDHDLQS